MIALIDVAKRGEVMQRLRGHEDEIHSLAWSPLDREGSLSSRSEDGEGLQNGKVFFSSQLPVHLTSHNVATRFLFCCSDVVSAWGRPERLLPGVWEPRSDIEDLELRQRERYEFLPHLCGLFICFVCVAKLFVLLQP